MAEAVLYTAQRLSALVMVPLVLVHLGLILYAIGDGLTANEILARTRGNYGWGFFYGLFVVAAAIHAPLGLRTILREWFSLRGGMTDIWLGIFALCLVGLGFRAVAAVV